MDQYRIDSHKLMFHVARVKDWLDGKIVSPIYLEIAPSGSCNHRCIFCALDYLNYKVQFLDKNILKKTVKQAAELGIKSVMYAGEGEPLVHKDISEVVKYTKDAGIDVSITTNGVLMNAQFIVKSLKYLSWIRISFNAGTAGKYAKIHGTAERDFYKALENIKFAVKYKKSSNLKCTIGVQFLMLPENYKEAEKLAGILKKIGADYLTIKPYSQHPYSGSKLSKKFDYGEG